MDCGAAADRLDRVVLPWPGLFPHLHPQPLCVGAGLEYCHSFRHASGSVSALAAHPSSVGLCWQLVRLRAHGALGAPDQDDIHRAPDPAAALVPAQHQRDSLDRTGPVCRTVH